MKRRESQLVSFLIALGVVATHGLSLVQAQRFSVRSTIFADGQQTAAAETLTLFHGEQAYDFMLTPHQEIAVIHWKQEAIELFDPARRRRCEVTFDFLLQFVNEVEKLGLESKGTLVRFAASPEFVEEFDEAGSVLSLKSAILSYEVRAFVPEIPQSVELYRQFADWSARLATTQKGAMPPTSRLRLNLALARHGVLPKQVRRTIAQQGQRQVISSAHEWTPSLTESDELRVRQVDTYRQEFPLVSFLDYRGLYAVQLSNRDRADSTH